MPQSRALATFARTSLFVLLVLCALIRPWLHIAGGMHEMEHAAEASAHGHHHGEETPAPDSDPDHVKGAHGLLHLADTHATTAWDLPSFTATVRPSTLVPRLDVHWRASQQPASPFRPPIA